MYFIKVKVKFDLPTPVSPIRYKLALTGQSHLTRLSVKKAPNATICPWAAVEIVSVNDLGDQTAPLL